MSSCPRSISGSTPTFAASGHWRSWASSARAERADHRPSQLSGGQQQRVSLARALMNGGQVILADEPTGALDSRTGAEVMALLKELNARGHTVILITHDREIAANAPRVIELHDGRVVAEVRAAARPARVRRPRQPGVTTKAGARCCLSSG